MARSYAYDDDNLISDIDKYINNPDYLPDINDQIDINNEEEQDENPEKEPDEYCYNYENEIDNDIKEDFVKTEDNFESNFEQNGFEQNVVDEIKEDEQAIDEPVDDNFDEQIDSTNEVATAHIEDNSKLNLLYDENQTLQENIDDIEITNNKSSKKIIVVSVISALLFGSLCYFGVNFYKNKRRRRHGLFVCDVFFLDLLSVLFFEQKGDCPYACDADQGIYNSRNERELTAEKHTNKVNAEKPDYSPV